MSDVREIAWGNPVVVEDERGEVCSLPIRLDGRHTEFAREIAALPKLTAALTAMLEETEGLVTLERRGLGLARYQALEAVEAATGVPFTPSRQQEPAR